MKKALLLLINTLLLSAFDISNAQNLVPNPGFENYLSCPVETGEIYRCQDWSSFGNTPDYFNACSPGTIVSIPQNNFGFQYAASGSAYAGFINESGGPAPPRDYLGVTLAQPLVTGVTYFASFKISFAGFACASSMMGITLSTVPFDSVNPPPVNDIAMVHAISLMNDSTNWYQVSGSFIADSAYTYLIIGNFFNTVNNCPAGTFQSYYYLDDICLSTDSMTCYTITGINEYGNDKQFSVFPNPFRDELNISGITTEELELTIYDGTIRKIYSQLLAKDITINTELFKPGFYFYELKNGNRIANKGKLIKY